MSAAAVPADLLERFAGRFEIEAKLGEGAMGQVWRVRRGDETFALKVLLPGTIPGVDALRRFLLEGKILMQLSHPNVLAVHELGEDPACPYLLCDLVVGQGLDRLIEREAPLSWARALEIMEGVLAGLAQAHERGIIHRDIKPSNVLVDADGRPRLADFGIAKATALDAKKTSTGMVMGTPAYIAPELVTGAPPSPSADVYSAGVMLFELVTGRLPFEGDEVSSILTAKLKAMVTPAASRVAIGVPPLIDRLIQMATAKEPHERFATAAAFLREIVDTRRMLAAGGGRAATAAVSVVASTQPVKAGTAPIARVSRATLRPAPPKEPSQGSWRVTGTVAGLILLVGVLWMGVSSRTGASAGRRALTAVAVEPLAPQEAALRDALVESQPGSKALEERIAAVLRLAPERAAAVLFEAWRRSGDALHLRVGKALGGLADARAAPALAERLAQDPAGDDPERVAAAESLTALVIGADADACPDREVVVSRLCTLLKKACIPGRGEKVEAVRAAVRGLAWLREPSTSCVEDIVTAPGCVGWLGNGLGDDPAIEARGALERIGSSAAKAQLEALPRLR